MVIGGCTGKFDDEKKRDRAELYIADWHRIRLITDDPEVRRLTQDIRDPADFTDDRANALLDAFVAEIGSGGLK